MSNHLETTASEVEAGQLIWWKSPANHGRMTRNRVASVNRLDGLVGETVTIEFCDGTGLNTRLDTRVWVHGE